MDFDKLQVSSVYNDARKLPTETMDQWKVLLLKFARVDEVKNILDLGCGTGRFTSWLANIFDSNVVGIDPGQTMLAEANKSEDKRVKFSPGSAENIPLEDESVDLVFMSMMYHAIQDKRKAMDEIRRVLKKDSWVVVRQATVESNNLDRSLDFFPESIAIGNSLAPTSEDLLKDFLKANFKRVHNEAVYQKMANSYLDYFNQLRLRGLSIFKLVSDEIFEKRLAEYKKFVDERPEGYPVGVRELFIFRK